MLTAVIGDVHGCIVELEKLLYLTSSVDKYILLGDLVDKGPCSPAVVSRLRELSMYKELVLIEGNHEEKHRRYRKSIAESGKSGIQKAEEIARITSGLSPSDIAFLDSAKWWHQENDCIFVHAGIPSGFRDPLPNLEEESNKVKKYYSLVMRVRYETPDGKMAPLGCEKPEDRYWAETYDGRLGRAYFGHQPFNLESPKRFPFASGLDLGCVHGGNLCAVILEDGVEKDVICVKADKVYADPFIIKTERAEMSSFDGKIQPPGVIQTP